MNNDCIFGRIDIIEDYKDFYYKKAIMLSLAPSKNARIMIEIMFHIAEGRRPLQIECKGGA